MKKLLVFAFLMFLVSMPAVAQVTLAWDYTPTPACLGFKIYETTTPGVYSSNPIATVTPCTTFTVTLALPSPGTYYYTATAYSATQESIRSNEVSAIVPVPPLPPPTNLRVVNLIVSVERKDAFLSADATEPAQLQFRYGRVGQTMKPAAVNTTSSTHGEVRLTRLSPRTTYAYQWIATANGQSVTSGGTFTTR